MRRSRISRMGARTPIVAYVGSRPIAKLATPMRLMVSTSMDLRPMRSPKWPKITPPRGRTT
jgi:hypothetical protein